MAWNLKAFFTDIAEIAPSLISGIFSLKNEAGSASKTQLATDSLSLATGLTEALTSNDPTVQADAAAASSAVSGIISSVSAAPVVTPSTVSSAIVQTALTTPPPTS